MKTDQELLIGNSSNQFETYDLSRIALDPISFMGIRGKHYRKDFFYSHTVYSMIKERILNENLTLILGNPLAGKTRIVFDSLSELTHGYVIKPILDSSIKEYRLPGRTDLIIFFDELDDYCRINPNALNKLLLSIIKDNIKCVATCRTGPEFFLVKRSLKAHIFSELHSSQVIIPRFDKKDSTLNNFINSNIDQVRNIGSFDGNMGALILPLEDMRSRYQQLVEADKRLPVAILKGLKLHYHLYNYESKKSFFDDSKILNFCEKLLQEDITKYEWEQAKSELSTDETTLNFIDENEFIVIEEAYLDFLLSESGTAIDVVDSTLNKPKILKLFNDIYKDFVAKKTWGFPTTIFDYNTAISKADSFKEAMKIFKDIPKQLKHDNYTYKFIAYKAENNSELRSIYSEMVKNLRIIDDKTHHAFASKFDSADELIDFFNEVNPVVISKRNGITDRLIKVAKKEPKKSLEMLFKKFSFSKIYSNPVLNEICRQCCNDDDDFELYVKPFINKINTLEKPLLINFIKTCTRISKQTGLDLLEEYADKTSFFYLNEKGNCLLDSNTKDALEFY